MTTASLISAKRGLLIVAMAGLMGWGGLANAQTTVVLTGGDAGQGLTLDTGNVVLAWDIWGSGSFTLQGVNFTNHTIGDSFSGSFAFDSGEFSANDSALSSMLSNGGWDALGASPIALTFSGLIPDASYRFDLIQSTLIFADREQAIVVNGTLLTLVSLQATVAYNTTFVATAKENGEIDLLLAASGAYAGTGIQDGAVLNALVLTAIPEPSIYATLSGLSALGLVIYRRQRRNLSVAV